MSILPIHLGESFRSFSHLSVRIGPIWLIQQAQAEMVGLIQQAKAEMEGLDLNLVRQSVNALQFERTKF